MSGNVIELTGKYTDAKMYIQTVADLTIGQVTMLINEPVSEGGTVRIMPDAHYGKGSTVGTTIHYEEGINKVVPAIVGVDIGCGIMVALLKTPEDTSDATWKKLDEVINKVVPSGFNVHENLASNKTAKTYAPIIKAKLSKLAFSGSQEDSFNHHALLSLGTLGGGNHFIEVGKDDDNNYFLMVHTGSRKVGLKVAQYYQKRAEAYHENDEKGVEELIEQLKSQNRHKEIESAVKNYHSTNVKPRLSYLEGKELDNYLNDMEIAQFYAKANRASIICNIVDAMGWEVVDSFDSVHNYIDTETNTIRKGATDASKGTRLVIPLNMRDGSIIGVGKGNKDWNNSAPHGAGRVLSRSKAKELLDLKEYQETMKDVYTTSAVQSTLDEAPDVYKDAQEIIDGIQDTVEIEYIVKPVYNFKAK